MPSKPVTESISSRGFFAGGIPHRRPDPPPSPPPDRTASGRHRPLVVPGERVPGDAMIERIIQTVAYHWGVSRDDMLSTCREPRIIDAKSAAAYLLRRYGLTTSQTSYELGWTNHSTTSTAYYRVERWVKEDRVDFVTRFVLAAKDLGIKPVPGWDETDEMIDSKRDGVINRNGRTTR